MAVAKAESDFNPKCVSSAGAKGIMQIMPYEAKELGVDDVFDAEQNIMASAKLLAAHLTEIPLWQRRHTMPAAEECSNMAGFLRLRRHRITSKKLQNI